METSTVRQLTLRLPEPLYWTLKQLASKRNISMNRLMQQSIEALVQEDEAGKIQAAYESIGKDAEESDVEIFFSAQQEVVNRDDS